MRQAARAGFTIVELLVVVSIIALLVAILLPAVGRGMDQARVTASESNLRNLAIAHRSYAAEWNDRQFTLVNDNISTYGVNVEAFDAYYDAHGGELEEHSHPGPILGWGYIDNTGPYVLFAFRTHEHGGEEHGQSLNGQNAAMNLPISFQTRGKYFGSFRLINVQQFNQYVAGRFYDRVFYAPRDTIPIRAIASRGFEGSDCFDDPGQYCDTPAGHGGVPVWSSYVLGPAAMFAPEVFAHDDPEDPGSNGWRDPWDFPGGHRSPALSQAQYPSLKTHMLEHHWLQNRMSECNPGIVFGGYDGCEPYYFDHAWTSSPVTLFYDGHVESLGVRRTMRADGRARKQVGHAGWGLWSQDTAFGEDGYMSDLAYDQAQSSYHILTTDGIRGRDVTAE